MNEKKIIYTRRDFLQTALVASTAVALPSFLSNPFVSADEQPTQLIPGFPDDRILVVVQLSGGNDGLNTVIPYINDEYYRARSQVLGLPKNQMIPLNQEIALHQSLAPLRKLYEDGKLAILNGVGYPNPNRSHFRSMDIWHSASDSDKYWKDGWIGRYFDGYKGKAQNVCGVNIGPKLPFAFDGKSDLGVSFDNPRQFKWIEGYGADKQEQFRKINKLSQTPTSSTASHSNLDYLRMVSNNAVISSDQVVSIGSKNRNVNGYNEGGPLGRDLKMIADLIIGRLPTRIYYASFGGFDTHANQPNPHGNLLKQLAQSLNTFYQDLQKNNCAKNVLIVTFSEFGRRVKENGSRGTDHGTAGPMFVLGDAVAPGFASAYPSLTDLDNGDLKHLIDFRAVYSTILEKWLKTDPAKVLGRSFPKLNFLQAV